MTILDEIIAYKKKEVEDRASTHPIKLLEQSLYFLASDKIVRFAPNLKQPFIDLVNVSSIYVNQEADYLRSRTK